MDTEEYIMMKNGKAALVPLTFTQTDTGTDISGGEDCTFLTIPEMVSDIINNRMEDDHKEMLTNPCDANNNIFTQIGFARWIRNSYGLWLDVHPDTNNEHAHSSYHPDQYSAKVVELITAGLNNMNTPNDEKWSDFDRANKCVK